MTNLPPETYQQICESLDLPSLLELRRTNWRAYQICDATIRRKEKEHRERVRMERGWERFENEEEEKYSKYPWLRPT